VKVEGHAGMSKAWGACVWHRCRQAGAWAREGKGAGTGGAHGTRAGVAATPAQTSTFSLVCKAHLPPSPVQRAPHMHAAAAAAAAAAARRPILGASAPAYPRLQPHLEHKVPEGGVGLRARDVLRQGPVHRGAPAARQGHVSACARVRVRVHVCVCACVRACCAVCVCACAHACVFVCVSVRACVCGERARQREKTLRGCDVHTQHHEWLYKRWGASSVSPRCNGRVLPRTTQHCVTQPPP